MDGYINGWHFAVDHGAIDKLLPKYPDATATALLDKIREASNTREVRRERYERALNGALDNLMMLEELARAEGFKINVFTHIDNGKAVERPDGSIHIVTAYGVSVS